MKFLMTLVLVVTLNVVYANEIPLNERIRVDDEYGYIDDCPFARDSDDFKDFVTAGILLNLFKSEREVQYEGKNLFFKVDPDFWEQFDRCNHNKGNINYDPYLPLPPQPGEQKETKNEGKKNEQGDDEEYTFVTAAQCRRNCFIVLTTLEATIYNLPINKGFKSALYLVTQWAKRTCDFCCGGCCFLERCGELLTEAYTEKLDEIKAAINRGCYDAENCLIRKH